MKKQKRIVVYMPEDQYRQLRAKLIILGKTVSGWFREVSKKFIKE